jgi:hypothetical protein
MSNLPGEATTRVLRGGHPTGTPQDAVTTRVREAIIRVLDAGQAASHKALPLAGHHHPRTAQTRGHEADSPQHHPGMRLP